MRDGDSGQKKPDFATDNAWGAQQIASMNGITTRLHWTEQPLNEGEEVFSVLSGCVEMKYRQNCEEHTAMLN